MYFKEIHRKRMIKNPVNFPKEHYLKMQRNSVISRLKNRGEKVYINCSIPECYDKSRCKNLCARHYAHLIRTGEIPKISRKRSIVEPKKKARHIVYVALRNGSLKRQKCFCGESNAHAHHKDYSKPLDIVWLCRKHHLEAHGNRFYNGKKNVEK